MTRSRFPIAVLFTLLALSSGLFAQIAPPKDAKATTRPRTSAATVEVPRFPWTLVAPSEPCPSHVTVSQPVAAELIHPPGKCSIDRVTDGDTVRLGPTKESVRLLGLDTEECFKGKALESPDRAKMIADFSGWKKTQLEGKSLTHPPKYNTPMGEAAKHALDQIVAGAEEARVEYDDQTRKIDAFGRILGHVLVRKGSTWIHVNIEIIRQGLSPYFIKYGRCARYDAAYEAAQKEAQTAKRGIWSEKPVYGCYDDYGTRLAWWAERARDLAEAHMLRKTRKDLVILGESAEGERLAQLEGKRITVFGSESSERSAGELVLFGLAHLKGIDFMVVGSKEQILAIELRKNEGNLVYVTGTVSMFKGQPQFKITPETPVTVSRRPPAAP